MSKKNLANAELVSALSASNSILVETGGSIRRITLTQFMEAIQSGGLSLRLYAWGVPIKQSIQSSPDWGRVGNLDMWAAFKAQTGRYLLSADGSKMAKLATNNSGVFADGTVLDESKGHVVFYAPKLYFLMKDDEEEGIPYLWMSQFPIGEHYLDPTIVGAYKASLTGDNRLTSQSGVTPLVSTTITNFWNYAQNNGSDFGVANRDFDKLMMMMQLSEFGTPDAQSTVGNGLCGSSSVDWQTEANTLLTGETMSLGDSCGNVPVTSEAYAIVNACHVNHFGVEDGWGWTYEGRQGVYFGSSSNEAQDGTEIFLYKGNRLPTSDELATHPTGEYRQLTRGTTASWLYIQEMILGEYFDLFMSVSGGGSSSYWCDSYYGSDIGQLCSVGGATNFGLRCGLGCLLSSYAFSYSSTYRGSRLAYYGTPTIVNGADM